MPDVYVRFECHMDDRVSQEYGPYDFLQVTYDSLRISPNGDDLAQFYIPMGYWYINGDPNRYSDFTIYSK